MSTIPPLVETEFPQSCAKLLGYDDGWARMGPDTPDNIPGNGQYFFMAKILAHEDPLGLEIVWPQSHRTDLPGFNYPKNRNFGEVLSQVCFLSRDRENWQLVEKVEPTGTGARIYFQPDPRPLYISTGIPYTPERLKRLITDLQRESDCRVEEIGKSRLGRELHGLVFEPEQGKPCKGLFLLQGFQHHTEWAGLHALDKLARAFSEGTLSRGDFAWAIVPCLNVDALHGGWREDLMHTHSGNGKCGNFNRDWDDFEYQETRAVAAFYRRLAKRWPVFHGLDFHMGWSSPERSGGGLTLFLEGSIPEEVAAHEAAFTKTFFNEVPIERFPWEVTQPDRSNFASWVWREFKVIGQTMEISRFQAPGDSGKPVPVSQAYYSSLGIQAARCLKRFFSEMDVSTFPLQAYP